MKYGLIGLLIFITAAAMSQQKSTFDLASYTTPAGWPEVKRTKDVVSYAITNNQTGTYCQLAIFASTISKGNLKADFESEWQELVVKAYKPTKAPELVPSKSEGGWEAQGGVAPFDFSGGQSIAMLVTMSGYERCLSIVVLTNTDAYQSQIEAFLESVDLKKPETASSPVTNSGTDNSIVGAWRMSASDNSSFRMKNGVMNYILRQYVFSDNGTYTFTSKAFDPLMDKIIFGRENGTFKIEGASLTITPQKSILQSWSKKDGGDDYGKLLVSENRPLEKVTYRFTKHYFSGIQEYNLVLQVNAPTQRDGAVSTNTTFSNAYYYSPVSTSHPLIPLPPGQSVGDAEKTEKPAPPTNAATNSAFAFTTTNFDDGWTSTAQENWVDVSKANVKVLLHYPNKEADAYNSDVMDGLKNAWNILVAPRYKSGSNFDFKYIRGWEVIEFGEADLVDNASGRQLHVVLCKKNYSNGSGRYMEIITTDKQSFEREFGAFDANASGWAKLESMINYNKFAVAASDLKGKWTSNFSATQQYVNAYTGANAGMSTHSSNENFLFTGNSYTWDVGVASGFVGNIKFQSAKSSGTFSLPSPWQVNFSDIEGKPRTYNAQFTCIKGARILWLGETSFGKVE